MMVSEPAVAASLLGMRDTGLKYIGLFLHREAGSFSHDNEAELVAEDFASPDKLHRVGVLAEVLRATPRAPGVELTLLCHHRIRWTNVVDADAAQADTAETAEYDIAGAVLADAAEAGAKNGNEETAKGGKSGGAPGKTLMKLHTEPMTELPVDPHSQHIKALTLALTSVMKESLAIGSFFKEQLELLLQTVDIKSPAALADLGASLTTAEGSKLQAVLEECDVEERLRLTLELLKVDLETTKVSRRIHERIEKTVSESQKRYFLQQQLVQIKRELGMEQDEKTSLITKFRERLADKTVPAAAMTIIEEGIEKLGSLEPASSEYSVTRNHLDWLTQVPWGKFSVDTLDLLRAQSVLDADHHGLKEVKERVLEFIAVSKLRGSLHGNILLLHGPPGVGKTSIAKTIAKSLSREYYRFSVGGLGDVSELKGHRRTYVGSVPGRFVVALKQTQVSNPIICIDEIDKLGRGWSGSPASALLETLDPEQNAQFLDAYLVCRRVQSFRFTRRRTFQVG
jgi:ATP-dependent Lon protease